MSPIGKIRCLIPSCCRECDYYDDVNRTCKTDVANPIEHQQWLLNNYRAEKPDWCPIVNESNPNDLWILITCENQDIYPPDVFLTYQEAYAEMKKQVEKLVDEDTEWVLHNDSAYVQSDCYDCDWRISVVNAHSTRR